MKINRSFLLAVSLLIANLTIPLAAQDGPALYKAKCAGCHGANGEGKPAMKAPALRGTSLSADQVASWLEKGSEAAARPPHKKGMAGVTADQAKAIADYVKSFK